MTSTAIAVVDTKGYLALTAGGNVGELIAENLGGDRLNEFDLPQIKVPAGGAVNWAVPTLDGEQSVPHVEGIIVYVASRRSFWEGDAEPDGSPPDCQSADMVTGVGNPGGACDACPFNQYDSATKGSGKACKEQRAVFLLRKDSMLPFVISVPPGSLKNFKKYMMGLASAGMLYSKVVTRFSLNKTKSRDGVAYAEIKPTLVGTVPPEATESVVAYAGGIRKAIASSR